MAMTLNRNDKRREQTRQKLVTAATDLFVSKGYNETTVDEICSRADVAKVTFYYHFQSKDDIVLEIKNAAGRQIFATANVLLEDKAPAVEVLKNLFATIAAWTEANWRLWQVFLGQKFQHVATSGSCGDPEPDPLVKLLIKIIDHGKASGEIRQDASSLETASFIALSMLNYQVLWIRNERKSSLLQDFNRCLDMVMNGIACR